MTQVPEGTKGRLITGILCVGAQSRRRIAGTIATSAPSRRRIPHAMPNVFTRYFRPPAPGIPCALLAATPAVAQSPDAAYQPRMGQQGKDVVWIPSPGDMVEKMLDMARVTPQDFVIDLGSGDGRNVIAAARRGARALGV